MNSFQPRSSWPQPSERKLSTNINAAVGSSFVDEGSQMQVVVLENVSMVFHRPYGDDEPDDEISYGYSLEAPSYLGEGVSSSPPRRLNSTDYAANHNISQYFRVEQQQQQQDEARDEVDEFDDNDAAVPQQQQQQQQQQPTGERPTLEKKDSILGSLPVLLKSAEVGAPPHGEMANDHKTYTDKLLGIDEHDDEMDSTTKTASMDNSSTEMELHDRSQKKKNNNKVTGWFKQLGKNNHHKHNKDKKKSKKNKQEKKHHIGNPFKRSLNRSAPRKALPKRSVSDLRRASF